MWVRRAVGGQGQRSDQTEIAKGEGVPTPVPTSPRVGSCGRCDRHAAKSLPVGILSCAVLCGFLSAGGSGGLGGESSARETSQLCLVSGHTTDRTCARDMLRPFGARAEPFHISARVQSAETRVQSARLPPVRSGRDETDVQRSACGDRDGSASPLGVTTRCRSSYDNSSFDMTR